MTHPLDEYPIHQAPLSMRYPATSDRDFYDRCIFQGHDRTGDIVMITGLGVYPNLGVIDAYATVRKGDTQFTVRTSDALSDDRMRLEVGPYRVEVVEPLQKIRLVFRQVLELVATPQAVRLLDELAGGAASARLTRDSAAARDRLRKR